MLYTVCNYIITENAPVDELLVFYDQIKQIMYCICNQIISDGARVVLDYQNFLDHIKNLGDLTPELKVQLLNEFNTLRSSSESLGNTRVAWNSYIELCDKGMLADHILNPEFSDTSSLESADSSDSWSTIDTSISFFPSNSIRAEHIIMNINNLHGEIMELLSITNLEYLM